MSGIRESLSRFSRLIRIRQWWDYKVSIALATAYALAWRLHIPYKLLWPALALLLAAGIAGAVFASVINDLSDIDEDRAQGKATVIMSLSPAARAGVLGVSIAALVGVGIALWADRLSFVVFCGVAAAFILYSVRPFRVKQRGAIGVVFIALGEHLLAALLSVALVADVCRQSIPVDWVCMLLIWSLALGARGILWHQLIDYDNDRRTSTGTMGTKYPRNTLRRLGENVAFPLEVVSFGVLLALTHNWLAWIFLAVYVVLEWLRFKFLDANIVIVAPASNFRFALFEYYQLFFPLAILISAAQHDPIAVVVLVVQIILFPAPLWLAVCHVGHLLRWRLYPFLTTRA